MCDAGRNANTLDPMRTVFISGGINNEPKFGILHGANPEDWGTEGAVMAEFSDAMSANAILSVLQMFVDKGDSGVLTIIGAFAEHAVFPE